MMNLRRMIALAALAVALPILPSQAGAQASDPSVRTVTKPPVVPGAHTNELVDINTASPDQLMALPGIGQAYSKRIIDGRPYTAKNQLVSRGILPKATYDGISAQIIAKKPAGK